MFPIGDVVFLGREGCNKSENKIAYRFKVSSASFTAYDIFNWVAPVPASAKEGVAMHNI